MYKLTKKYVCKTFNSHNYDKIYVYGHLIDTNTDRYVYGHLIETNTDIDMLMAI